MLNARDVVVVLCNFPVIEGMAGRVGEHHPGAAALLLLDQVQRR